VAVAYAGATIYVVLLAALHVAQPQMIDDATISKYALGPNGWMLQVAFVAAGVGYAALANVLTRSAAIMAWLTAVAFAVMGAFRIDSVGPTEVISIHGALHTGAFFVVVVLTTVLMFAIRRRAQSPALRILPLVAPVLVVVGFLVPGLFGALVFRAWTLSLVTWVVLTVRKMSRSHTNANVRTLTSAMTGSEAGGTGASRRTMA
jgi:hypothetical protein